MVFVKTCQIFTEAVLAPVYTACPTKARVNSTVSTVGNDLVCLQDTNMYMYFYLNTSFLQQHPSDTEAFKEVYAEAGGLQFIYSFIHCVSNSEIKFIWTFANM